MPRADELLPYVSVLALTVRRRGCHDESRAAVRVQIAVEIRDPEIVGVADFLLFLVYARQSEWQPPRRRAGVLLDPIHVERRVRHDVVAFPAEVMRVMIEGIRRLARLDDARESVHCHVHQAELRVVGDLLLSVECHGGVRTHARCIHEVPRLDEHAARAAGGIEQDAARGGEDVHDHLDEGFWCEENTVVRGNVFREFVEEVLIDAPDDVAADSIEVAVVEDAQQLREDRIGEFRIAARKHAAELVALLLDERHGVVDGGAEAGQLIPLFVADACARNIGGEMEEIVVLCLLREVERALRGEVALLHRHDASATCGSPAHDLCLDHFVSAVGIAQEDQPENGHAVLIRCEL